MSENLALFSVLVPVSGPRRARVINFTLNLPVILKIKPLQTKNGNNWSGIFEEDILKKM